MTSTFTPRNRLNKQGDGDNTNTWGDVLNAGVFDMLDAALDAGVYLTPAGNTTLSTANGVTDQARCRFIKFQAGSVASTTTIPALEKLYLIWNASTAAQTIVSSGGGSSAVIQPGESVWIACDATNVVRATLLTMNGQQLTNLADPTSPQMAATRNYVDTAIASATFTMGSFGVPIVPGNAGMFLTNNGSVPSWASVVTTGAGLASVAGSTLTVTAALSADVLTGTNTTKAMTVGATYGALTEVALTDAATISVDLSTFINAAVTFNVAGASRVMGNPANPKQGQTGYIRLIQDGSGSRTLSFGSNWKRQGGAPTLTTTANAVDVLEYQVLSPTYILYNVLLNPS